MLYHLSFQIVFETNWESNPPIDTYDYLLHLQLPQVIIYQSSILPISYLTPYSPSKGSGKSYLLYYSVKCMNCTNIRRVNYICHAFAFVPQTRVELAQTIRSERFSYHYSFHYQSLTLQLTCNWVILSSDIPK